MAHTHRKLELPAPTEDAPAREDATRPASRITFVGDAALVEGIVAGNPAAMVEFHDRFAVLVQRILWGILGPDRELSDLHHDVFVRALSSIRKLQSPDALRGWISAIAVHTAKSAIEKRLSRRRWMTWGLPETKVEGPAVHPGGQLDAREALRAIHALLDQLPVAERIVFALRFLDGLGLSDVALACDVSLATVKRRLASAEARFADLATRSPVLLLSCGRTSRVYRLALRSNFAAWGSTRWRHRPSSSTRSFGRSRADFRPSLARSSKCSTRAFDSGSLIELRAKH